MEYVPNKPIRELVEKTLASGEICSYAELAKRVGLLRVGKREIGESTTLARALGIRKNGPITQRYIRYDLAMKIIIALGKSPVDYGV